MPARLAENDIVFARAKEAHCHRLTVTMHFLIKVDDDRTYDNTI